MASLLSSGGRLAVLAAALAAFAQPASAADVRGATPGAAIALPDGLGSHEARRLAEWAIRSGDSEGLPILIIDKMNAKVFAFRADGSVRGAAAALLGVARGDISPAGIGSRKLADISPFEKITPAGRFHATPGRNLAGKNILWIDYDSSLSLHGVVTGNPNERRSQRLSTPSPLDNRISYGCINVPQDFFETIVTPLFSKGGMVYILPESGVAGDIFPAQLATR